MAGFRLQINPGTLAPGSRGSARPRFHRDRGSARPRFHRDRGSATSRFDRDPRTPGNAGRSACFSALPSRAAWATYGGFRPKMKKMTPPQARRLPVAHMCAGKGSVETPSFVRNPLNKKEVARCAVLDLLILGGGGRRRFAMAGFRSQIGGTGRRLGRGRARWAVGRRAALTPALSRGERERTGGGGVRRAAWHAARTPALSRGERGKKTASRWRAATKTSLARVAGRTGGGHTRPQRYTMS